jgi:DNA-binding SARP family transcriptional activator/CheY-like chemotaxis protein
MSVRLTLLGTFALEIDGVIRELPTRKCEALLVYLALRREPYHRRDSLAGLLWGDVSMAQARHSLRQAIWRLKRVLAAQASPPLIVEGENVRLDRNLVEVDARTFEMLAASSGPEDLARASALYRGDLVEGLQLNETRADNWLASERSRLHHMAIDVLVKQLHAAVDADQDARIIDVASSLLALDGTQEHVHRVLMRLYRKQGRPGDALQQYNFCARVLQQELGVEPDLATRELCQEILVERARGVSAERAAVPLPKSVAAPPRSAAPTILVLESDPVTRATVERILRSAGYDVVLRAATGSPTLPQEVPYRAVICGLAPSISRTQLLSRLRGQGFQGFVLFLSGEGPWPHISEPGGIRVGYIRRPVRPRTLLATLREAIGEASQSPSH